MNVVLQTPCFVEVLSKAARSHPSSPLRPQFLQMIEKIISPQNYGFSLSYNSKTSQKTLKRYLQFLCERHRSLTFVMEKVLDLIVTIPMNDSAICFFLSLLSILVRPLPIQEEAIWQEHWKKSNQKSDYFDDSSLGMRSSAPIFSNNFHSRLTEKAFSHLPDSMTKFLIGFFLPSAPSSSVRFLPNILQLLSYARVDIILESDVFWIFLRDFLRGEIEILSKNDAFLVQFKRTISSLCHFSLFRSRLFECISSIISLKTMKDYLVLFLLKILFQEANMEIGGKEAEKEAEKEAVDKKKHKKKNSKNSISKTDSVESLSFTPDYYIKPSNLITFLQLLGLSLKTFLGFHRGYSSFALSLRNLRLGSDLKLLIQICNYFLQKMRTDELDFLVESDASNPRSEESFLHHFIQTFGFFDVESQQMVRELLLKHFFTSKGERHIIRLCYHILLDHPIPDVSDLMMRGLKKESSAYYFAVELGGFDRFLQLTSDCFQFTGEDFCGMFKL
jgi:hypothetical protein